MCHKEMVVSPETTERSPALAGQMTAEYFAHSYERGFIATSRFLRSRGIQTDSVPDIAQAAWAKAWERREQLRDVTLLLTWVNSIALNVYRSSLRQLKPSEALSDVAAAPALSNVSNIDVKRMLGECKPIDRTVLESHYISGYNMKEIALENQCSETAVRIRLLRARRRMKLLFGAKRSPRLLKARRAPASTA